MKKDNSVQNKMFLEMKEAELFRRAESFGLNYLDSAFNRNVYPSKKALNDLAIFEEEFPEKSGSQN